MSKVSPSGTYFATAAAITLYVSLCTWNWDNHPSTDAWEHHRAVVAMAANPSNPGNPTYATSEPSVRYSPYTWTLATISRLASIDPFRLLCVGAIVNTVLLFASVFILLRTYGAERYASYVPVVMVALWGGPPGYANSFALADLPWHQLNPSAFAYSLSLLMLSMFQRAYSSTAFVLPWLGISVAGSLAMLSHGMTGLFGFLSLGAVALAQPSKLRWRHLALLAAVGLSALAMCAAWPFYDFLAAATGHQDPEYWLNRSIIQEMLTIWCMPAILLSVFTIELREMLLVRVCLLGGGLSLACALVLGAGAGSASMARLPMPAMIFLHIPLAMWLKKHEVLSRTTWPQRLKEFFGTDSARTSRVAAQLLVVAGLGYLLVPQLWMVAREPYLGRPYIAWLVHKRDKQRPLKPTYDALMKGVDRHAVVMGPVLTVWPVPSSSGRVVAAAHFELFTPGQPQRCHDTETFFNDGTGRKTRLEILDRYQVQYLILDPDRIASRVFRELYSPGAVIRVVKGLVLMDAAKWRQ